MIRPTNMMVLTYWSYGDALIQAYTLPYVRIIKQQIRTEAKIYLVTLEQKSHQFTKEEKKNIKEHLNQEGIIWKPFTYSPFGIRMMIRWGGIFCQLYSLLFIRKIDVIHTWCTPAGAIGYFLSSFSGKPLVLDSFEPHAEPMVEAGQWKADSLAFEILFYLEKKQARHASLVIACVDKMKEYAYEKYGVDIKNFYSKPACVDFSLFDISKAKNPDLLNELKLQNQVVCVYAGKFGGSYLKQEVFDFFKACHDHWKDAFRVLLLSNHPQQEIENWASQSGLPLEVIVKRFVPHHQVPDYMGLGDFAIVPFVPVPSKRYGSPIKTGEYMAMGLPIVITTGISDDSTLTRKNNLGYVLNYLTHEDYTIAVKKIDDILKRNSSSRIINFAKKTKSLDMAQSVYQAIYA